MKCATLRAKWSLGLSTDPEQGTRNKSTSAGRHPRLPVPIPSREPVNRVDKAGLHGREPLDHRCPGRIAVKVDPAAWDSRGHGGRKVNGLDGHRHEGVDWAQHTIASTNQHPARMGTIISTMLHIRARVG